MYDKGQEVNTSSYLFIKFWTYVFTQLSKLLVKSIRHMVNLPIIIRKCELSIKIVLRFLQEVQGIFCESCVFVQGTAVTKKRKLRHSYILG